MKRPDLRIVAGTDVKPANRMETFGFAVSDRMMTASHNGQLVPCEKAMQALAEAVRAHLAAIRQVQPPPTVYDDINIGASLRARGWPVCAETDGDCA